MECMLVKGNFQLELLSTTAALLKNQKNDTEQFSKYLNLT